MTESACNIAFKDWRKTKKHFGSHIPKDYDFGANLTNMLDSIEICEIEGQMNYKLTCLLCSKDLLGEAINGDQTNTQIKENTKKTFQHFLQKKKNTRHTHM